MRDTIRIGRRQLLAGGAGAVVAAGLFGGRRLSAQEAAALPGYADWKDEDVLIIHSDRTIETERDALGSGVVTPADRLYIRNNVAPPDAAVLDDPDAWEVAIEGVASPATLTVGELRALGFDIVAMVLQCSGNGRAFYEHETSGTQWQTGAAGCVIWTGVPLARVVEHLGGAAAGAQFITGTGGETIPEGIDPKTVLVERSVPVDMLEHVMLAWEMNGEPISLAHGGPLRMIVPGYTGVNSVKYVKRVALTEAESDAAIQTTRYRLYPVGGEVQADTPSVWAMPVKSWVTAPIADVAAGLHQIGGVALGGMNPVAKVEVSTDGGGSWQEAALVGPDLGRFAWRAFVLPVELAAGSYTLTSRATDSEGNVQPEAPEPNNSGYNHNGWRAHAVTVTVA
jgi:sulfite oxidase